MIKILSHKMKLSRRILALFTAIFIINFFPIMIVRAETTSASKVPSESEVLSPTEGYSSEDTESIPGRDAVQDDIDEADKVYNSYIDVMPKVSTNDMINWVMTKGNEIIYFLQIIIQPITTIFFIINALLCLVGSIGRGDMVGKGVWGMIICAIVYAAVLYAPVILQTFVGWASS